MSDIIAKETRDDFVQFIDKRLKDLGFNKDPEKELWVCEKEMQNPGQTVIINGQRHDQPGEVYHITFQVNIYGDGNMRDLNSNIENPFVEVDFDIIKENIHSFNEFPTFCLFYDDQILFNSLLNQIFGL